MANTADNQSDDSDSDFDQSLVDMREAQPLTPGSSTVVISRTAFDKRPQWILAVCASFGGVAMGAALGWSSPALPGIQKSMIVTENEISWISSLINVGAALGGPSGALSMDWIGRRGSIIVWALPATIAWMFLAYATDVWYLYVGRCLLGFCAGATCVFVPAIIGESSRPEIRGTLGACFQLAVTIGVLFSYTFGMVLSWKSLANLCQTLPVMTAILMFFMPESPVYLIESGNEGAAQQALQWLRGPHYNVIPELASLRRTVATVADPFQHADARDPQSPRTSWLPSRAMVLPLLVSLGLMLNQQFCGINAVLFYTEDIFQSAGSTVKPALATVIVGITMVAATLVGTLLMDLAGRRILLMLSNGFMAVALAGMGIFFYLKSTAPDLTDESFKWLPIASLCLFISAFSIGVGPIPWLITGEIFPPHTKKVATSIATAVNWSMSFVVTKMFLGLVDAMGSEGVFGLFAGLSVLGFVFTYFFVPETKGKSLEEIEEYFIGRSSDSSIQYRSLRND
ncbi:unnamed protein product [Cyprideis torosa]|uniref:Uncharacterized protein n=1 Tax=Cyprideis torosa TaxID=163714 RepID=A0A7R8WEE9_9CRUS|nr:unnamed protein product [Cyprideis torosa]CAG0892822.1 unnamed protein product [Cyprideis torosa]